MNVALFYHSLLSDWNHGNAHFLRGISSELISRGHNVSIYEPEDSWSLQNLLKDHGEKAIEQFHQYYPTLKTNRYNSETDLHKTLADADLVIVHEWNEHDVVRAIGEVKKSNGFTLLFHDTHHRAVSDHESMSRYDLSNYDGVLAYGEVIRKIYLEKSWTKNAWTWHEAADVNLFHPIKSKNEGDLVWVGNWGDDERTKELHEFLINPVKELNLKAKVYGVRYPPEAIRALADSGIEYGGWLPNYKVPEVFAKYRFTVHVPRGPYVKTLPGIPTIRPFEALACGIPMISAPWSDAEQLFTIGKDFLMVNDGEEMMRAIQSLLTGDIGDQLAQHGLETISSRHTCAHRVDQLLNICEELRINNLSTQLEAS